MNARNGTEAETALAGEFLAECSECGREALVPYPGDPDDDARVGWHVTPDGHLICWACVLRSEAEWGH